jgi:selenide,water dikinase
MLNGLVRPAEERLLVGFETSDDAGVFKMPDGSLLVQTVDFITPVVDDAYTFGRVSALNSVSDVYAMGGTPLTALSVLSYNCDVDKTLITAMMQGACDQLSTEGCALVGGHTVSDTEIKLGFAVTGTITDGRYFRNCDLREGDLLIYTKALGIGLATTAIKAARASEETIMEVTTQMLLSNGKAAGLLRSFAVSGVTDVTGFGLAGHGCEMAKGAELTIEFDTSAFSVVTGAPELAAAYIVPAGAFSNQAFLKEDCDFTMQADNSHIIFFDPQTSGGLLIGVSEKDAEDLLKALKDVGYSDSAICGRAVSKGKKPVILK